MGGGIWAMHFVAMLAYRMPGMVVSYDFSLTLLSFSMAMGATWAGFRVMRYAPRSPALLVASGTFMGLGIVSMHYTGMSAMRMHASLHYDPWWVATSIVIAVVAATVALWLSLRENGALFRIGASLVMGAAVSGMHYAAMRGAIFTPLASHAPLARTLGQTALALGVSAAAFAIVSIALAVSVFDRRLADIARREAAALRVSEERHRSLYSGTPLPLLALDARGCVEVASDAWLDLAGRKREDVVGQPITAFMTPESAERMRDEDRLALKAAGSVLEREHRLVARCGAVKDVVVSARVHRDADGAILGVLCGMTDVTERRQAEEALRQAQKLEAIGQLTGGVAHDFNNLLAVVVGNLDLASRRLKKDPQTLRLVENALEGASRGASLTQRLLAFARRQDLNPAAVDVPALVAGMSDLMTRTMGPRVVIETDFPADLPAAKVDAHQLEMAILNLVVNARDAMPEGGRIVIGADEVPVDGDGRNLRIRVKDEGCGMDAETLARASEPFFTTKGVGKGTGLGLSMAQGLAAQSGGRLHIRSAVGRGTTIELLLPLADTAPVSATPVDPGPPGPARPVSILVVDDDVLVLENTVAMLEDLGHRVVAASSGREALDILPKSGAIDLVITDHLMPGMTGAELAANISASRPWLPVLLASGFTDRMGEDGIGHLTLLPKPFGRDALDRAVRVTIAESNIVRFDKRRLAAAV